MTTTRRGPPHADLWAYAYDITLPESEDPLPSIQRLLDREHSEATFGQRTWAAQLVVEPQVTRILVVSDSPEQDRPINRSLEAMLGTLRATFLVSAPMPIPRIRLH